MTAETFPSNLTTNLTETLFLLTCSHYLLLRYLYHKELTTIYARAKILASIVSGITLTHSVFWLPSNSALIHQYPDHKATIKENLTQQLQGYKTVVKRQRREKYR